MRKGSRVLLTLVVCFVSMGDAQQSRANLSSNQINEQQAYERRFALVIGNSAYSQGSLKNPINDAESMAAVLRHLHFEVTLARDVETKDEFARLIKEWGNEIPGDSVALFYYAGHGVQAGGKNYLIPTSAVIFNEQDIINKGMGLDTLMDAMTKPKSNQLNIVILDACRNELPVRGENIARGLVAFSGPRGTYIAYSTAPGSVASDGTGANGLFTEHLLDNIEEPSLTIEDLFKLVRRDVIADPSNKMKQTPWDASSMVEPFLFNPGEWHLSSRVGPTNKGKQHQTQSPPPPPKIIIRITIVPPRGAGPDIVDEIGGTVSGVDVNESKVVIFALGGSTWYVQPLTTEPYTSINKDGTWKSDTHLGSEYAALLVKQTYKPMDMTTRLPAVGGDVLAVERVTARK